MRNKLVLGTAAAAAALIASGLQSFSASAAPAPSFAASIAGSQVKAIAYGTAQAPQIADSLGLGAKEKLTVKDVVVDADGTRHLRYDRTYAGLPVLGGDLVVHETKSGATKSVSRATSKAVKPATLTPAVSAPTPGRPPPAPSRSCSRPPWPRARSR